MKRFAIPVFLVVFVAGTFALHEGWTRVARKAAIREQEQISIPEVIRQPTQEEAKRIVTHPIEEPQVNWDVPFTSQAPLEVWDEDHKEACEEASMLMVLQYFSGEDFLSKEHADELLLRLVRKNDEFGFAVDQTAQQVAALLASEAPDLRISVVSHPTEESLKDTLRQGFLVIVPAAGRHLGNPYFRRPGPLYHMLVIRGFTDDEYVITNDPGTKRGENFVYAWETILSANHDWNDGDVEQGEKVVITVGPYVF